MCFLFKLNALCDRIKAMNMIDFTIKAEKEYKKWCNYSSPNDDFYEELIALENNEDEKVDCFYRELNFGTSGMRGILGPGPNRINSRVIKRATQGLANYINKTFLNPRVVVCYDSRKGSYKYAKETAAVLNGNGIEVYLFPVLSPVPCMSYSVNKLNCHMGVMITASHNPKIYNGYKVYNNRGYQIIGNEPGDILNEINSLDFFQDIPWDEEGLNYVDKGVSEGYINEIIKLSTNLDNAALNEIKTIYTPFNGTGMLFVDKVFHKIGYNNYEILESQKHPDENFTTCPQPNPEKLIAFDESFKRLDEVNADIIIGTDPDADRIGLAFYHKGVRTLLTGNELGILILDYLCQVRPPKKGQVIGKSIMTSPLGERIGNKYGLKTINSVTGFKYIGDLIKKLEDQGNVGKFYYGFEESNGYLIGTYTREKDGVSGAMITLEMVAYNKSKGKNLVDRLEEIYQEFGMCKDKIDDYFFSGIKGKLAMEQLMAYFRKEVNNYIGNHKILRKVDYLEDTGLPKADVVSFDLDDGSMVAIRPSGTEAKLKVYSFATENFADVEEEINKIINKFKEI